MDNKDLQSIIDGCIKFDRQSQELLYKRLYGFAMKICLRYAGDQNEASEILNEGFFKVFTGIKKYDKERPFKTWFGKIMNNASIDYYRRNLKWNQSSDLDISGLKIPEDKMEDNLNYQELIAIIQNLPNAYRLVFNLYVIDGYSHDEIAEMIGISASTSRSNLYKARMKLQQMLSEYPGGHINHKDNTETGNGLNTSIISVNAERP